MLISEEHIFHSNFQEEYEAACKRTPYLPEPHHEDQDKIEEPSSPGIAIGPYQTCHHIASGLTSTVYRSGHTALKLIHTVAPPHNPRLEAKILTLLNSSKTPNVIKLLSTLTEQSQFILVFPYMPLTLADLLDRGPLPVEQTRALCRDVLRALAAIHARGILHRDIKPSSILLEHPSGPALLSDFGTAWHPDLSSRSEPADAKVLDIGTGPYRPPETLFGNKSYSAPADMWAFGVLLSECASTSSRPKALFASPPTHEDGSQLGLILSVFETLGTPTVETWPEAAAFKTRPFDMWRVFPRNGDEEVFGGIRVEFREVVRNLLVYESGERMTAAEVLGDKAFKD